MKRPIAEALFCSGRLLTVFVPYLDAVWSTEGEGAEIRDWLGFGKALCDGIFRRPNCPVLVVDCAVPGVLGLSKPPPMLVRFEGVPRTVGRGGRYVAVDALNEAVMFSNGPALEPGRLGGRPKSEFELSFL